MTQLLTGTGGRGWIQDLGVDVQYALRTFGRAPLVPTIVVLTFVVGIGVNTVAISVAEGLLFRAQVTRDPASFVRIYVQVQGDDGRSVYGNQHAATVEEYEAIRSATRTLTEITASKPVTFHLVGGFVPNLRARFVSCNYLTAHHGPPLTGRGFAQADCATPPERPVAVLSRRGWMLAFGGDPSVVGRTVRLNNQLITVIGVSSAPFEAPERLTVSGSRLAARVVWSRAVSPAYFSLTGARVLRGGAFSSVPPGPNTPTPVVVSEALADALFPEVDEIGQPIRFGGRIGSVIGVVANVSSVRPGEPDGPILYRPIDTDERGTIAILARVEASGNLMVGALETIVRQMNPAVPVTVETVATTIARMASQYQTAIALTMASSGLAMGLVLVGLFGTMTFVVVLRAKEVGIRMALGAERRHIVGLFIRSVVRPLITGVGTGLPVAVMIVVLLRQSRLLVGVTATDPWPYGVAIALVVATLGTAALIPAIAAGSIEPSTALRQD